MTDDRNKCTTKYPLLLVHGIGFAFRKNPERYWGRIPRVLTENGAIVYCASQDGWGTVENNAGQLKKEIENILSESGADKVNVIAHSKGGLDVRYLASKLGMTDSIASITTLSTPHRGSKSMDALMKIPDFLLKGTGVLMKGISKLLGDKHPNFFRASMGLRTESMKNFNEEVPDVHSIYYQSYGSVMEHSTSDVLMMIQNLIIRSIEGDNDGLVTTYSAPWGEFKGILVGPGKRGISHPDMTDMRRRPFSKEKVAGKVSDIVDFYVELVEELKNMGF